MRQRSFRSTVSGRARRCPAVVSRGAQAGNADAHATMEATTAMRRVWMPLFGFCAMVVSGAASAQMQPLADCTSLSIHLTGIPEAAGARCQGDEDRANELIDASGPDRVFVIRHQSSGGHDYLRREEVTDIVKKLTAAATLDSLSERLKFEHFFYFISGHGKQRNTGAPLFALRFCGKRRQPPADSF